MGYTQIEQAYAKLSDAQLEQEINTRKLQVPRLAGGKRYAMITVLVENYLAGNQRTQECTVCGRMYNDVCRACAGMQVAGGN